MSEQGEPFLIAEFGNPGALTAAARRVRDEGFRALDALTPCPVEGIDGALDLKTSPVRWPMLIAEIGVVAFAMVSSRGARSSLIPSTRRKAARRPIFLLAPIEVGVLAAGLADHRLPRPLRPATPQPSAVRLGPNRAGDRRSLFPPDGAPGASKRTPACARCSWTPRRCGSRRRQHENGASSAPVARLGGLHRSVDDASAALWDERPSVRVRERLRRPAAAGGDGVARRQGIRPGERCSPAGRHGAAQARQGAVRDLLCSLPRL